MRRTPRRKAKGKRRKKRSDQNGEDRNLKIAFRLRAPSQRSEKLGENLEGFVNCFCFYFNFKLFC